MSTSPISPHETERNEVKGFGTASDEPENTHCTPSGDLPAQCQTSATNICGPSEMASPLAGQVDVSQVERAGASTADQPCGIER